MKAYDFSSGITMKFILGVIVTMIVFLPIIITVLIKRKKNFCKNIHLVWHCIYHQRI